MGYEPVPPVTVPDEYDAVAVCDLEGTLTASDLVWAALGEAHGVTWQEAKELYERFNAGEFTQEAFRKRIVDRWHEADEPPTRQRLERVMNEHLELDPTADKFIKTLQEEGYYTVIASGALDSYSDRAVDLLDIDTEQGEDVSTIWAEYTYEEDIGQDVLDAFHWTQYKSNKEALINDIRDQAHVDEIVAVGNSGNDIRMVEAADTAYMVPSDDSIDYQELETRIAHLTVAPLDEIVQYLEGQTDE